MIEFSLRERADLRSGVVLLGFVDFDAFVRYVREHGPVELSKNEKPGDPLVLVKKNGI